MVSSLEILLGGLVPMEVMRLGKRFWRLEVEAVFSVCSGLGWLPVVGLVPLLGLQFLEVQFVCSTYVEVLSAVLF
jgi:hypothetical protein